VGGRLLVGTSGYVYAHWRHVFYPRTLAMRDWLPYYAARFATVELNNPFYRLPSAAAFVAWRDAVPPGFVFAVKASRFLTHMKRLKAADRHLRLFLERARRLGPRLGPVLFQLPPTFHVDVERLDGLLRALDRQRLVRGLRAAIEVRHESWLIPEVYARLRRADVALCFHDSRRLPVTAPVTARFVYVRRHGFGRSGNYPERMIRADAAAIRRWLGEGRDVYVYYNNDARGFAIANARRLARLLGSTAGRAAMAQAATKASAATAARRSGRPMPPRAA
jgi:uncharacterized protein YecE (DUF72 family)